MESTPEDPIILEQRQGDEHNETSSAEPLVADERVAFGNADYEMNPVNENFASHQLSESYSFEQESSELQNAQVNLKVKLASVSAKFNDEELPIVHHSYACRY